MSNLQNFQNMGTFDGGIIGAATGGSAANLAAVPIMDEAGIASGQAFLVSELEKRDSLIRQPLSSITYPRDIPVAVGGGWVDYASAMGVSYGISGGSGESPIMAGGANGLPVVQANTEKGMYKAHAFAAVLRVMFQDMQRANYIGRSLDQLLQQGMRLAYDKHMDENVYMGFPRYGTTGLLNNPNAVHTTVANNGAAASSTKWADKTPDQILQDVNSALLFVWAANEYDREAIPNHVLLPYEQYAYILQTKVTELAGKTILDFLLENNIAVKEGGSLYIGATAWAKGAGVGGADRMTVYVNNERFLKVEELVPLMRAMSQPNVTNFCYDTAYAANISEVELFYPTSLVYFDGI